MSTTRPPAYPEEETRVVIYKCRLCGKTTSKVNCPSWIAHLAGSATQSKALAWPVYWPGVGTALLFAIHHCDDGRQGIADLAGAAPQDKENGP